MAIVPIHDLKLCLDLHIYESVLDIVMVEVFRYYNFVLHDEYQLLVNHYQTKF